MRTKDEIEQQRQIQLSRIAAEHQKIRESEDAIKDAKAILATLNWLRTETEDQAKDDKGNQQGDTTGEEGEDMPSE